MLGPVALLVSDPAVLSSLEFALSVEGYALVAAGNAPAAAALVIDQGYAGDGLGALIGLRERGCAAPSIVLATNPSAAFRARAAGVGAAIIEKPLLGDDLSCGIAAALEHRKAA